VVVLLGGPDRGPEVVVALEGVRGREPDVKLAWGVGDIEPDPGRLTGVVGRGVLVPRPSLMMDAMEELRACPAALAAGEPLGLVVVVVSAEVELEIPRELRVGVCGSSSASALAPVFERWSLIAVLNDSGLALSFVVWTFGFGF